VQEIKQTYYNACLKVTYNLCCLRFLPRETSMAGKGESNSFTITHSICSDFWTTYACKFTSKPDVDKTRQIKQVRPFSFRKIDFIKPKTGNESEQ